MEKELINRMAGIYGAVYAFMIENHDPVSAIEGDKRDIEAVRKSIVLNDILGAMESIFMDASKAGLGHFSFDRSNPILGARFQSETDFPTHPLVKVLSQPIPADWIPPEWRSHADD